MCAIPNWSLLVSVLCEQMLSTRSRFTVHVDIRTMAMRYCRYSNYGNAILQIFEPWQCDTDIRTMAMRYCRHSNHGEVKYISEENMLCFFTGESNQLLTPDRTAVKSQLLGCLDPAFGYFNSTSSSENNSRTPHQFKLSSADCSISLGRLMSCACKSRQGCTVRACSVARCIVRDSCRWIM